MNIDYQQKIEEITHWIKKTVHEAGFEDVLVAVSGGIDSALALALSVKALGKEHVYALRLPYGKMSSKATEDAKLVAAHVGLEKSHVLQKDIYKVVNKIEKQCLLDTNPHPNPLPKGEGDQGILTNIRMGNIMARVRMVFLYDTARSLNCLVVGTENKSEYYLGYFTRFGDEASDIEPIRSLYKTQVREMARILGLPEEIITKPPTAGLWEGQTDEKELGFSYEEADKVLYHYFDEQLLKEAIVDLGIPEKVVEKVLERVEKNDFKHHLPKVYDKSE